MRRLFARPRRRLTPMGEIVLRPHRPGDMGWLLERHAIANTEAQGWNARHEADIALILAQFLQEYDPARERFIFAERDGRRLGSVGVVDNADGRARLRVLWVEPEARGLNLGRMLVDAAVAFARQAGYRELVLGTMDALKPARRIYKEAGFKRIDAEPHNAYGVAMMAETWTLSLT